MPTISTLHASHEVPEGKLTGLGLYVTAQEAYEMWKADPERVKVLDVRMVEEYVFLGHAAAAVNIPVAFPKYEWHADRRKYGFEINPDFVDHVKAVFKPDDTIEKCAPGRAGIAGELCAGASFRLCPHADHPAVRIAKDRIDGRGHFGRCALPGLGDASRQGQAGPCRRSDDPPDGRHHLLPAPGSTAASDGR